MGNPSRVRRRTRRGLLTLLVAGRGSIGGQESTHWCYVGEDTVVYLVRCERVDLTKISRIIV